MDSSQQPPLPLPPLSEEEAKFYYSGLPSCPRLVGRTSKTEWKAPGWPDAYSKAKELRPVGMHAINEVWEGSLSLVLVRHLERKQVSWTSIDIVRIGCVDDAFPPVILWIGVEQDTLSFEAGRTVASSCKDVLVGFGITDVDVEIRESRVMPLVGPKLLAPTLFPKATIELRNELTATLGLPICCKETEHKEGTGGVFIGEGGDRRRLFLLTARHVVLGTQGENNRLFEESSDPTRHDVMLMGGSGFQGFVDSIDKAIEGSKLVVSYLKRRIKKMTGEGGGEEGGSCRDKTGDELIEAEEALGHLESFLKEVTEEWAMPERRKLGHVVYSPPIEFASGTDCYTKDFALIEIDQSRLDSDNFKGNVIDLGVKIPPEKLIRMLYPDFEKALSFEYPEDRLLRVQGTIPEEEIRSPPSLNQNSENCLIVLKHGRTSGLTVGRAVGLRSVVHSYMGEGVTKATMEWAILQYDKKSAPFSATGDSGACVVDGNGRLGGIITGGAAGWGDASGTDVTYASSINSLMVDVKAKFPSAHLNPQLDRD